MTISTHLPGTMSPDERRAEIAELLAQGVLRHLEERRRRQKTLPAADSSPTCLEVPGPVRLSVPTG